MEKIKDNKFKVHIGNKKVVNVKFIKKPRSPFVTNGGPKGIKYDRLLIEKFRKKEQIVALWHESYHCRWQYSLRRIMNIIKYIWNKESFWIEEYSADEHSVKNNPYGKKATLSYLRLCKDIYNKKIVPYNPKTHPLIIERIKRIEAL